MNSTNAKQYHVTHSRGTSKRLLPLVNFQQPVVLVNDRNSVGTPANDTSISCISNNQELKSSTTQSKKTNSRGVRRAQLAGFFKRKVPRETNFALCATWQNKNARKIFVVAGFEEAPRLERQKTNKR